MVRSADIAGRGDRMSIVYFPYRRRIDDSCEDRSERGTISPVEGGSAIAGPKCRMESK
jgi:hypothetical protein